MNTKLKLTAGFMFLWFFLQMAFSVAQGLQSYDNTQRYIDNIEKRVALDLPKLRLANLRFKTVADNASVKNYIRNLNSSLESSTSTVYLHSIQGIALSDKPAEDPLITNLATTDQQIELQFIQVTPSIFSQLNLYAPFMAGLIIFLSHIKANKLSAKTKAQAAISKEKLVTPGKLIINLREKSIHYDPNQLIVTLPNKPFCFYAALVDYCLQNDTACLRHNNDVPEELLLIANKYFYRLIELGHTKRKRPDFGANLDKTLSEIRSALDEVFQNHIDSKELFYPPKAQGEGSRSKMHNYALLNTDPRRVEFIGK